MSTASEPFRENRPALILSILAVVAANIPFLRSSIWYSGDTTYLYEVFYIYYNQLIESKEFIQWLPYGSYGIPAFMWQITYLGPFQYLLALTGFILQFKDAAILFKLSMIAEQIIFVLGLYLLCCELFKKKWVIIFTCLTSCLSMFWFTNAFWNFRLITAVPWCYFFLLIGFRKKNMTYFGLAGIAFVTAQCGAPAYMMTYTFLLILAGLIFWGVQHSHDLKGIFQNPLKNYWSLGCFVLFAGMVIFFTLQALQSLSLFVTNREPGTGYVDMETFLTFGRSVGFSKLLNLLFPGYLRQMHSLYTGILPLIFAIYALLNVRKKEFYFIAGMLAAVILFSAGDAVPLARSVYTLFPPIRYFRYIGAAGAVIRLFLILTAAYGLEQFLNSIQNPQKNKNPYKPLLVSTGALALAVIGLIAAKLDWRLLDTSNTPLGWQIWPHLFKYSFAASAAAILLIAIKKLNAHNAAILLTAVLVFDLGLSQWMYHTTWRHQYSWIDKNLHRTEKREFLPLRAYKPVNSDRTRDMSRMATTGTAVLAKEYYNFINMDNCRPREYTNQLWTKWLNDLIWSRFSLIWTGKTGDQLKPEDSASIHTLLGCHDSKLRFLTDSVAAENREDAIRLAKKVPNIGETVILERETGKEDFFMPPVDAIPYAESEIWQVKDKTAAFKIVNPAGTVKVLNFTYNTLTLETQTSARHGGWLYYADAWHPGWKAELDGRRVPVVRANLGFKALRIPEGNHKLMLRFHDPVMSLLSSILAAVSLVIAILSLTLLLIILIFPLRTKQE